MKPESAFQKTFNVIRVSADAHDTRPVNATPIWGEEKARRLAELLQANDPLATFVVREYLGGGKP
jgi:hypothetical protein